MAKISKKTKKNKSIKVPKTISSEGIEETKVKKTKKSKKSQKPQINRDFLDLDYRFKNNNEKWITIILMDNCNLLESYKLIQGELEDIFGEDVVYFFPLYIDKIGKKDVGVPLFECYEGGYIFVKYTSTMNVGKFDKTDHLDSILHTGSNDKYVTNRDINRFKTSLKKEIENKIPKKGDWIIPKEGTFKSLEGKVISVRASDKTAVVEFSKKTRVVKARLTVINFDIIN